MIVPSIPCFEIWYLFHVSDSRKPYSASGGVGSPTQVLIRDLKNFDIFANCDKVTCDNFFKKIKPMRHQACLWAEKALQEDSKEGQRIYHENPSTRAYLVVQKLYNMASKQWNAHQIN